MDPIQDHAAAQASADVASAASVSADPGILSPLSEAAESQEIEVVCTHSIQSRELGVIAEPGERRIIPHRRLDAFLRTEAFQMLGPVVRLPASPSAPQKTARRSKTE